MTFPIECACVRCFALVLRTYNLPALALVNLQKYTWNFFIADYTTEGHGLVYNIKLNHNHLL